MSDIAPIGRPAPTTYSPVGRPVRSAVEAPLTRGSDVAEFSRTAQLLSKIDELPAVRQDLIDRVRQQIADGTYESPEKLHAAVEALAGDLQNA